MRSTGSRRVGFSSCGSQAQYLWHTGLVVPWHVGSSQTRAPTSVPCIGRWILNHCATREVLLRRFPSKVLKVQPIFSLLPIVKFKRKEKN